MSNHKLSQIFYDGLGLQDRYLLDVACGSTFMSKFNDDSMELIKTVVETSHHNAAKTIWKMCHAERTIDQSQVSQDMPNDNMQS